MLLLARVHAYTALYRLQTAPNATDTTEPSAITNANSAVTSSITAQNVLKMNVWNAKRTTFFSTVPSVSIPAKRDAFSATTMFTPTAKNA